jgi:hypothetical protein
MKFHVVGISMEHEFLNKIIPNLRDYSRWKETDLGEGITLFDYAGFVATPDILCAIFSLFFPACVFYRGGYFLANHFDEALYETWSDKLDSTVEIQRVLNHVHVSTVLQNQEVSDMMACQCAELLGLAWERSLRQFDVRIESGGSGYDDAYVTFFQAQ